MYRCPAFPGPPVPNADLLGTIALEQQEPPRRDRPLHAAEDLGTLGRRQELDEDGHHGVVGARVPVPVADVRFPHVDAHALLGGKGARLRDAIGSDVEGGDVEPARGEEHAVAPLAIGDAQHGLPARKPRRLAGEERVRRTPEVEFRPGEARVPGTSGIVEGHAREWPCGRPPMVARLTTVKGPVGCGA